VKIYADILISAKSTPNEIQKEILKYYLVSDPLIRLNGVYSLDASALEQAIHKFREDPERMD